MVIDPLAVNRQGNDTGIQYRTGIFYTDEDQIPVIKKVYNREEKKAGAKLAVVVEPVKNFYSAEEYHQKYLEKNPGGYCHIPQKYYSLQRKNIILIGMPAVGKSTVGVILAKILGYDFVDSDLLIQKRAGKLLKEIIEELGVDGFISLENDVNSQIRATGTVIATGGSAVYGAQAMRHFQKIGMIIYLKVSFDVLQQRLDDIQQRGVILREGQTLAELYQERCVMYEQYADTVIDEDGKNLEEIIKEISERI